MIGKRGRVAKAELASYLTALQMCIDSYFSGIGFPEESLFLSIVMGDRYAKIEARKSGAGSVSGRRSFNRLHNKMVYDYWTWGFIDLKNGDCLRADSYKTPSTRTPRGNIRDRFCGLSMVTWCGYEAIKSGDGLPRGLREVTS